MLTKDNTVMHTILKLLYSKLPKSIELTLIFRINTHSVFILKIIMLECISVCKIYKKVFNNKYYYRHLLIWLSLCSLVLSLMCEYECMTDFSNCLYCWHTEYKLVLIHYQLVTWQSQRMLTTNEYRINNNKHYTN